jgi:L-ascorbate metabolism protein UlaG (beta-lactamase superfamily)
MKRLALALLALGTLGAVPHEAPSHVDITWMSVTNMYYEIGPLGIVTDGYITRIPPSTFFGGKTGGAQTHAPQKPDSAAVARVLDALGGPSKVQLLLSGHSHWDHSFDTGIWTVLTGARVIGPRTSCLQVEAQRIPRERCTPVYGGEKFVLADGVTMRVVRWNHSGDPSSNPEQHNPVELDSVPRLDPATLGMRAGMAEDFPNGGGSRAFLFTVDGPDGRLSWFFHNTASPVDLATPIVVDGVNYGAPLENLKAAMKDAGLTSVDLWIGTGGVPVAQLVVPVLAPKAFLPVHWDSFFSPFKEGVTKPYADPALEEMLSKSGVQLVRPTQYMDKWRLDRTGVHAIPNASVKGALGFGG